MKKITSPRILVLTEKANTILESWLKTTRATNERAIRARILLALHDGYNPTKMAQVQNVSRKTVYKWIHRYEASGIEGLDDEPRPGRPSVLTPETIERVLRMTTEEVPLEHLVDGEARWDHRLAGAPDLGLCRSPAASDPDLQDQQGARVGREGDRDRRAVHEPVR